MLVKIKLHDILRNRVKNTPGDSSVVIIKDLPEGTTVGNLLTLLGFDSELVGLVTVNGWQVGLDFWLKDGDNLELFSPMAGG